MPPTSQASLYTIMYFQPPRLYGLDEESLYAEAMSSLRRAENRANAARAANAEFMAKWMEFSRQQVMMQKRSQDKIGWEGPDPEFLASSLTGPESLEIVWEELKEKQVGVDGDRLREALAKRATGKW